ncbi:putative NODULIN-LIKE PROTEIN [Salix purpurea]|uniref:NODULIN-LIKE PROTEIN n=1 Tax=Salix purpurea TaxID=77065 RepID=A0A9Q0W5W7_SALPP|nr:putative NODULIN-LIKE PROTEIN [Salix purpurea]
MEAINTKWIATVASIWIQSSAGASYTFGIYSSVLKSSQGYDQSTLDTVSVFKDIGANAGILSGLLYSAVTLQNNRRRLGVFGGPWVVLLAGAIQSFLGYFVMWASVVGLIRPLPVAAMCFVTWMAAHAQTFYQYGERGEWNSQFRRLWWNHRWDHEGMPLITIYFFWFSSPVFSALLCLLAVIITY